MAEEKKEFTIIENADCISKFKDQGYKLVAESIIGRAWGDKTKGYKVCAPVPETDEQAKELYNLSLAELVHAGVMKIFTQVDYETTTLEFDTDGKVVKIDGVKQFNPNLSDEEILERMQTAVDNYQAGTRAPGKKKIESQRLSKMEELAKAKGFDSVDDFIASLG